MLQVYLINMVGTDYYKIGYTSRHISKRLSEVQVGINCSVLWLDIYKKRLNTEVTQFVSFRECGINEYINCKIPY